MIGMSFAEITERATQDFGRAAGETVYVIVRDELFDVFCTELAMYRLQEKYMPKVISKGYSSNEKCWYISIKHNLPKGFIRD